MTDDPFALTAPEASESPRVDETRGDRRRRLNAVRRASMRAKYGHGPEAKTCGHCVFLLTVQPNGHGTPTYFKCKRYGISRSESTDWRAKWSACGLFEQWTLAEYERGR